MKALEAYKLFKDFPFDFMNLNYAANSKDESFSPLYIKEMTAVAAEAFKNGGLKELIRIRQFRKPLAHIESQTRTHNYCGAGKSLLQTDTKGDLYACNWFMDDKSESVGHQEHIDLKKLSPYKEDLIQLHNCNTCWARHLCGGGCMFVNKVKHQDKHKKDHYFCQRTRSLAAVAINYYIKTLNKGSENETH